MPLSRRHWGRALLVTLLLAGRSAAAQTEAWTRHSESALAAAGEALTAQIDLALAGLAKRGERLSQAAPAALPDAASAFAFLERSLGPAPTLAGLPLGVQLLRGDEPLAWLGHPIPPDEERATAGPALGSFGVYRFLSLRGPLGGTGLDWLLDLPLAPRLPGGGGGLPTLLAAPAGLDLRVLPPESPPASAPGAPGWRSGPSESPGSLQGPLQRWTLSAGGRELLEIQLQAPAAPSFARATAAARRAWLGLVAALLIVAVGLILRWRGRRLRPGGLDLPLRALFLSLWVLALRLVLRWGELPALWLGGRFWSARDFALDVPGGVFASPGEFLISALAALLLLVLVLRPYLRPEAEREGDEPARTSADGAGPLAQAFALLAPLAGVLAAWRFAAWVYANTAPALLGAEGLSSLRLVGFDVALFLAEVFLLCLFLVPAHFAWRRLPERRLLRLGGGLLLVLAVGALAGLAVALTLALILPVAWGFRRAAARLTGLLAHAVLVILAATLLIEGAQETARRELRADLAVRGAGAAAGRESLWLPQQVEETLLGLGREPGLRRDLPRGRGGDAWLALAAWQSADLDALGERGALELYDARGRLRSRYQRGIELAEPPRRPSLSGERADLSLSVQPGVTVVGADSLRFVEGELALVAPDGRPLGWVMLRLREGWPADAALLAPASTAQRLLAGAQRLFLHLLLLLVLVGLDLAFSRVEPVRRRLPSLLGPHGLGFQHKLLFYFLIVAMLPVLLTGLLASRQLRAEQDGASLRTSLERVRAAQRSLENRVRQEARDLAASEYVRNFIVPDFPTTVRDIGSLEHNRLMIFNGAGELLLDESLRNWQPAQVDSFLAVVPPGRVVYEREGRRVHAGILLPMEIWHRERRIAFTVYYRLQVDASLLDGLGEVVGGGLNLYSAGSLLYADRPELFGLGYQSPMLDPATVRALADGRAGARQDLAHAGGLRLGRATLPLADARDRPLALLSSVEVAGLAGPAVGLGESASLIFSMIALLMILALLLGSFLAGRVFLPVRRLQLAVRRLSAGDLAARLPAGGADEIGELMTSFNRMAEGLQATRSELEQRRRFLESVLENVASGVLALDGAGRLVSANAAARRLLALEDERLEGLSLAALAALAPAADGLDRGALFRHLAAHPGGLRGLACELRLQAAEGARTLRLADADPTGERVVVFTDVSELIRSQKLAAWSEMARQVAHEIKNPLTPIKLSAQMMERAWRDRREDFDGILGESLASIDEQVEILRRIAQEFSQFGRRAELSLEPVDLGGLLAEILAPYRDTLQVDWQGPTALTVRADREALRKVLLNLVENAREAMEGAGRLEVALAGDSEGGGELALRDHGSGIPEEALGRLFEPYFSTKTRGTGLGLAISAQLVEEMGGRLRLENHPGGGAVARLALPPA
ncbi:HAMP domain-containing protein [bacterium]|nr:HAMP domain-containing protein [bacterium]